MKLKLAAVTMAAFIAQPAFAADLGGNCCADLEERVAELEATTARKGNRKVSLTVSGHVHEALMYFDVSSPDKTVEESNVYIGTHNSSRSRFRFRGEAQINADWSAGFYMEFGVRRNALNDLSQDVSRKTTGIDIRHEALYVKSKTFGTIWLGWTGSATEGITEICLGCGLGNASPDYSFTVANLIAARSFGGVENARFRNAGSASGFFPGEGDRRNMIKWISPTVAGFSISAAVGGDDFWDAALRYAGEFGSIRIAAGIGYSQDTNGAKDSDGVVQNSEGVSSIGCVGGDGVADRDCRALGLSASVMHTPTGLYIRGSYGENKNEAAGPDQGDSDSGWEVTAGVKTKVNALGATNFWGVYGETEREIGLSQSPKASTELSTYGFGVQQNIDAAAMEMYLWWRHFEATGDVAGEASRSAEADVVVLGARIKF